MSTASSPLRVLFIHGKESSPLGKKGQVLAAAFDYHGRQMDTDDFAGSVALQAQTIERVRPDVVVGSSFGGAVLCELLQRGAWRGPSLLLAPATRLYDPQATLPKGVPVMIVHGRADTVVPLALGASLAASGDPALTRFCPVDDDHRLSATVDGGGLPPLVVAAHALGQHGSS